MFDYMAAYTKRNAKWRRVNIFPALKGEDFLSGGLRPPC